MNVLILCLDRDVRIACETRARLNALGHATYIKRIRNGPSGRRAVQAILALEEWSLGKARYVSATPVPDGFSADLVVDLTGREKPNGIPVLTIEINGYRDLFAGLASVKTKTREAAVVARIGGRPVAQAYPMISQQTFFYLNRDELFTGVQSLIIHTIARLAAGPLDEIPVGQAPERAGCFSCVYTANIAAALWRRLVRKLVRCRHQIYWQTAWRFVDGPGVAETKRLDGNAFSVLADDGQRFYADPFLFETDGKAYIFVEEFLYASGKGVISVSEMEENGRPGVPRPVLTEKHHLSYPNVFRHKDEIFMVPESGESHEVVLYRADTFPDRWVRHATLIQGHNINDATFVERDGRLWMFATERFGQGSASDTMVVFSATDLHGPWLPHKLNPILIDKAGARPGGKVVEHEGRFFLPVQNGSEVYGGGLGLREIIQLDDDNVVLGPTEALGTGPAWKRRGIHTLNRSDRLEVVDSTWED